MAISKVIYKSSPNATPETWMDATPATATAADIVAPLTAMLANGVLTQGTGSGGGSSSGLVYETGTWTPAADTDRGTISFANTHAEAPIFVAMSDVTEPTGISSGSNIIFVFFDPYKAFGSGFPYSNTATRYGIAMYSYRTSSGFSNTGLSMQYNSDDTGDTDTSYTRYWATETKFYPYSNNSVRYWRSGRTYKWIAVWKPAT